VRRPLSRWILAVISTAWGLGLSLASAQPIEQIATVSVYGQVIDENGTPLPGVKVEAVGLMILGTRITMTDASGTFLLELPPGPYQLTALLEGFSTDSTMVQVSPGASQSVELRLEIGTVEEEIVVVGVHQPPFGRYQSKPSWNSWLEARGTTGQPVERLEAGKRYNFYLDLAPLAYRLAGVASADAGPGLVEELKRALADGRTVLTAHVRPVPVGRAVRLLGDRLRAETWHRGAWAVAADDGMVPMDIRLANLLPDDVKPEEAPADGPAADLARAGGVRFPVEAVEPGCGAITLSIWNEDGRVPLDHVVHIVTVGDADCRPADDGAALRAGFVTLLRDTAGTATQAALHLFEVVPGTSGDVNTVAVYVPDRPAGGCQHYAWVQSASLSHYLFVQPSFRGTLRRAWQDEGARYPDLAGQLRRLLFPPHDDGRCGGWAALESLRQLASRRGQSLFVRVVDPYNRSLFVPLRLLFKLEANAGRRAEGGGGPIFAEPPTLRQPLPVESYGDPGRCVGSWSFLLPQKLHGYLTDIELPPGLAEPALLRDLDDLRDLIETWADAEPAPDDPAVGLVILAHHAGGALSTDDPDEPWLWTEFGNARVPRGSVALLSACATGDPTRSRELVSTLSHAGFDTIILSPFDVHTPFGVRLATSFSRRVNDALTARGRPRVADLYVDALAETVTSFELELGERAHGMALEFLLGGHGELRLCGADMRER
jgi:hypothetical protein